MLPLKNMYVMVVAFNLDSDKIEKHYYYNDIEDLKSKLQKEKESKIEWSYTCDNIEKKSMRHFAS